MATKIKVVDCTDWAHFKHVILSELFPGGKFSKGAFVFRGQRCEQWSLTSSFDRWVRDFDGMDRVTESQELLKRFKARARDCGIEEQVLSDEGRVAALAQHHGLPTRLLDWSDSPYVAAFFAFSDALTQEDQSGEVAVWALRTSERVWTREYGVEIVRVRGGGNERLRNQAGCFTYSRTTFETLEEYVESAPVGDAVLTKFIVPQDQALLALPDLEIMSISASRLLPGLDGCALDARLSLVFDRHGEWP